MKRILYLDSPIGTLEIKSEADAVVSIQFVENALTVSKHLTENEMHIKLWFEAYFAKEPCDLHVRTKVQGTDFQKSVWTYLNSIPFGTLETYSNVASHFGGPKQVRAIGGAIARNPFMILVPCHRIVGVNGALQGYAGGLEKKFWLIEHESAKFSSKTPTLFPI